MRWWGRVRKPVGPRRAVEEARVEAGRFASALSRAQQCTATEASWSAAASGSGGAGMVMHVFWCVRTAVGEAKEAVERDGDMAATAAEVGLRAGVLRAEAESHTTIERIRRYRRSLLSEVFAALVDLQCCRRPHT